MKIKIQLTKCVGCTKAVLRGEFIPLNADVTKEERSKSNNLNFHLSKLEKEEKIKSKERRIKELI